MHLICPVVENAGFYTLNIVLKYYVLLLDDFRANYGRELVDCWLVLRLDRVPDACSVCPSLSTENETEKKHVQAIVPETYLVHLPR